MNSDRIVMLLDEQSVVGSRGCLTWTRSLNRDGYGSLRIDGKYRGVHRLAFEVTYGPIPEGLQIDHLCRNRACVNPLHLEAVPKVVNTMRGMSPAAQNARKTHCKRGHEFTPENTKLHPDGRRECHECIRQRWQQIYAARRAARALITDCPNGHPRAENWVVVRTTGKGRCKECMADAGRRYRARLRAVAA